MVLMYIPGCAVMAAYFLDFYSPVIK